MAAEVVEVGIDANIKQALEAFAALGKVAETALKKFEKDSKEAVDETVKATEKGGSSIAGFFGKYKGLIAGFLGAIAVKEIVDFFGTAISEASKADAEIAKLTASLKSVGDYTPQAVKDFDDFAGALEETSKFSGDAVVAQLSLAKQLGLSNDEAKKLVQASADLASVTGDSLDVAFADLSKTLSGTSGALGKTIPEIDGMTAAQLKSGAAIDLVAARLKGASEGALQSFGGAMLQAENASGDFVKAIGKAITQNPVVVKAIQAATKGFRLLEEIIVENQAAISGYIADFVKLTAKVLPPLIDSLGFVVKAFQGIATGSTAIVVAVTQMISSFLSFEIVQDIIRGLSNFITSFYSLVISGASKLVSALASIPGAAGVLENLGVDLKATTKSLDDTANALKTFSLDEQSFGAAQEQLAAVRDSALDLGGSLDKVFSGAVSGIDSLSSAVRSTAKEIIDADGDVAKAATAAADAQEAAGQAAIKAANEAVKKKVKALAEEEKARKEFADFQEKLLGKEIDDIGKIDLERKRSLEKLKGFQDAGVVSTENAAELRGIIERDADNLILENKKKTLEEFKKSIQEASRDPLRIFVDLLPKTGALADMFSSVSSSIEKGLEGFYSFVPSFIKNLGDQIKISAEGAASVMGTAASALKGKAGAQELISNIAGTVGDALLPGIGPVVSQIAGVMQQGPDAVKAMIGDFAKAIPELITNLISAVPVLITSLAEAFPTIITGLFDNLIAGGQIFKIAGALAEAIFKSPFVLLGGKDFTNEFADKMKATGKNFGEAAEGPISRGSRGFAYFISKGFKDALDKADEVLFNFSGQLLAGVGSLLKGLTNIFDGLGTSLMKGFVNFFTSIFKGLAAFGAAVITPLGEVLTSMKTSIIDFGVHLKETFIAFGDKLVLVFTDFGDNVATSIKDAFSLFGDSVVTPIAKFFENIGDNVLTPIAQTFKDLLLGFGDLMGKVLVGLTDGANAVGTALSDGTKAIFTGIEAAAANFGDAFHAVGVQVSDLFKDAFGPLLDVGAEIGASIKEAAGEFGAELKRGFDNFIEGVQGFFRGANEIYNKIEKGFKDPLEALKGIFDVGNITESFATAFENAGGRIKAELQKVFGSSFADAGGEIYKELKSIFTKIADVFKDLFDFDLPKVGGGGGGGGNPVVNGVKRIGDALGLARGGLVPEGFPGDTFPARLTSGELVVPRDLVRGLEGLIARDERGSGSSDASMAQLSLLTRIAGLLAEPMQVSTTAEVDGRALADIILNLSRQNARLA